MFVHTPHVSSWLERRRRVVILAKATEQLKRLEEAVKAAKALGHYSHAVTLGAMHTSLSASIATGAIYRTDREGNLNG